MEKKTIGAFIAVLRKASGMTQRELADKLMGRRTLWGRKLIIYISVLLLVCAFFIAKDAICSGSVISEQPVNFGALVYIVPAIITAGGALLYALAVKKERAATNKQSAG